MDLNRQQTVILALSLGIAAGIAYYFMHQPPMAPVMEAVYVRSTEIQRNFVQKCDLQINGKNFDSTKHIIPSHSEIHITGLAHLDPEKVEWPVYVSGFAIIGYRPKGASEKEWRTSSEQEWVGGQTAGKIDYTASVTAPPGEYELRAYILMDISGMETPTLEYVLRGEAVITD